MPRTGPTRKAAKLTVEQEIAHLRDLDLHGLRARWKGMFRRRPTPHLPQHLLFAVLAYRLQADARGDLDPATARLLGQVATSGATLEAARLTAEFDRRRTELKPGTILMREWNGRRGGAAWLSSKDRKGTIVEEEAKTVRHIFRRYLELGSLNLLLADLRRCGIKTKVRPLSNGRTIGGIPFTRGPIAALLRNRFYVGEVRYKGEIFPGEQVASLDWGRQLARSAG